MLRAHRDFVGGRVVGWCGEDAGPEVAARRWLALQGDEAIGQRLAADAAASPADADAAGDLFVIEDSLGYLVNFAAKLFARDHAACLAAHAASPGQWAVLLFLSAQDGQSQTELSRQVAIEDATLVRTIDRLERDGLVRRVRNPHDRRHINIFLTEKGRALRDTLVVFGESVVK